MIPRAAMTTSLADRLRLIAEGRDCGEAPAAVLQRAATALDRNRRVMLPTCETALVLAEAFMSGFEDDPVQRSLPHDLREVRSALRLIRRSTGSGQGARARREARRQFPRTLWGVSFEECSTGGDCVALVHDFDPPVQTPWGLCAQMLVTAHNEAHLPRARDWTIGLYDPDLQQIYSASHDGTYQIGTGPVLPADRRRPIGPEPGMSNREIAS